MISVDAIGKAVHRLIDDLQDCGSQQDYYRINHCQSDFLTRAVTIWLQVHGVRVGPILSEGESPKPDTI